MNVTCPRCKGGCSIVCCALCGSVGYVSPRLKDEYYKLAGFGGYDRDPGVSKCKELRALYSNAVMEKR